MTHHGTIVMATLSGSERAIRLLELRHGETVCFLAFDPTEGAIHTYTEATVTARLQTVELGPNSSIYDEIWRRHTFVQKLRQSDEGIKPFLSKHHTWFSGVRIPAEPDGA